jgi:hypothetical protein
LTDHRPGVRFVRLTWTLVLVDSVPLESQLVNAPTPAILAFWLFGAVFAPIPDSIEPVGIPTMLLSTIRASSPGRVPSEFHPIWFWIKALLGEITTLFRKDGRRKLITNVSHKPG